MVDKRKGNKGNRKWMTGFAIRKSEHLYIPPKTGAEIKANYRRNKMAMEAKRSKKQWALP